MTKLLFKIALCGQQGILALPVWFGFCAFYQPNKSVKGTRRPLAVLKFGFLSRFGGFAKAQ